MKEFETLVRHDLPNPRTLTGAVTYALVMDDRLDHRARCALPSERRPLEATGR